MRSKSSCFPNLFFTFLHFFCLLILFSSNICAHRSPVCNLSQTNLFFVGRKEQLQKINAFFKKGDRIIFAITGGPGFGKTQIAKKYAHSHQQDYDFMWWIDAQQDIPRQFEKLALALNTLLPQREHIIPSQLSKEALVDTVKDLLRIKKVSYLLIFDNPQTYAQVVNFIPTVHYPSGKHILLTSRNANIWIDTIDIGQFKRNESLHMIKAVTPQESEQSMIRLAETLSDYPLGLSLSLSFIKSHPTLTIDKYIAMHFGRPLKEGKETTGALLDRYPKNALEALEISLRYIEKESKDSLQALFFMSLLNSKDIPESYIELWLKKAKSSLLADDVIKHIYDQSLIGVSETIEFNVHKDSQGQKGMYYLSIHDLIHQLINEKIPVEEKKELIEKAATVMLEIFSGPSEIFTLKVTKEPVHLLHAQKLCENARKLNYSSPNLLKLKICIFESLMGPFRDFEAAKYFLHEIEKEVKANNAVEPYYEALFKINKGYFESIYEPNYDKAIGYMNEGLSVLNLQKEYHEEKLRAISNLIQFHSQRGESSVAEQLINEGKNEFDKSLSESYNGFFLFVWSLSLISQGKFEDSAKVLRRANDYPHLEENYPTIYYAILYQWIETLIKQGRLNEALKNLKEFEEKTQKFFQKRKTAMGANALVFRSLILLSQKKNISKAIQNLSKAIEGYNEFFHGDKKHRNQARAHLVLGKAYACNKNFKKALKEYIFSEKIYNALLKNKKIDDISELYTEFAILGAQLKDDGLTHKYLNTHVDLFGVDHPRTRKILDHLDHLKLEVPN